jgi:hypothetical protein
MLTFSIIVAVLVAGGYLLRKNFRRSFYVLWTGDENPDWEVLEERWWGKEQSGKNEDGGAVRNP